LFNGNVVAIFDCEKLKTYNNDPKKKLNLSKLGLLLLFVQ